MILDLGSRTGTYVNGERIATQQELKNGDELKIGRHLFSVSIGASVAQLAASEDDFFELLDDSSDRLDSDDEQEEEETAESTVHLPPSDIVNEPHVNEPHVRVDRLDVVQKEQKEMSFSDLRRDRETPLRRKTKKTTKTPSVDDNPTEYHLKVAASVLATLCLLGLFGVWLLGEPTNPYGTVPIVGTLTLDGEPVEGVSVILSPRDRENGRVAGGITDRHGKFTVTTGTATMVNGAVPGEYDVTFSKMEIEEGSSLEEPNWLYVIPQKYRNTRTSGLAPITVEPDGKNNFSFELSSVVASP